MLQSIPDPSPDPTATRREARQEAHPAAIDRDAVIEVFVQLIRDSLFEETNALTLALRDLLKQPPENRWELDALITWLPYRDKVEIGGAVVRLIGEACLHIAGADERPF